MGGSSSRSQVDHVLATAGSLAGQAATPVARSASGLHLHLGCGERYLDGYVNIDFPDQPGVQRTRRVDMAIDLRRLRLPAGSCRSIRSHHVFEHFTRVEALAQLLFWHEWLEPDGEILIETPDLEDCLRLLGPEQSAATRSKILRHLFGSQEAAWAAHLDAWDAARFRHVLPRMGFDVCCIEHDTWQQLANVTVAARRFELAASTRWHNAELLLAESLVDDSESERRLLSLWRDQLRCAIQDA